MAPTTLAEARRRVWALPRGRTARNALLLLNGLARLRDAGRLDRLGRTVQLPTWRQAVDLDHRDFAAALALLAELGLVRGNDGRQAALAFTLPGGGLCRGHL